MASNSYVDFAALKASVSIEDVLNRYELTHPLRPKGDHKLVGPCPLCESQHDTAFQADTEKDCWYCFSEKAGGSVLDFVAQHEDISIRAAGLQLAEWFDGAGETRGQQNAAADPPANEPLGFALEKLQAEHPHVQKLGIRPVTAAHFGAGYCENGLMEGRLAIPVRNPAGELVAYAGRATDGEEPEYLYPDGFDRAQEVMGLYRVAASGVALEYGAYLVAEPTQVLRLWQAGVENAVSYLETDLSARQVELLEETLPHARRLTIICRPTAVPRAGAIAALARSFYVKIVSISAR